MDTILAWYDAIGWVAVVVFLVGWLAVGFVAVWLLRKGSILGAFPAALFGVGAHISVELQIPAGTEPSVITSILPTLSGILCVVVLFGTSGKEVLRKVTSGTKGDKEDKGK